MTVDKAMNKRINVTRSSMPPFDEYVEEIKPLWDSRWLTNMGEKHKRLETMLRNFWGVNNVSLMVNGHMALELGLQAMGIKGEIITTPFTFASTTHAIVRSGSTPVFCDINRKDFTIDVEQIESLITKDTVAILPVHVYGNICDVDEIDRIAKKYNLKVIYDAAHAFGERYKGKSVMQYGDMSMISFHATKVFHTIEGGALAYNDYNYSNKIAMLRDFGIKDQETIELVGANAKMNEFAAAMGLCNLRHIDEEIQKRKKIVEQYRLLLDGLPGVQLNTNNDDIDYNYAYFPVVIDEKKSGYTRDEIQERLKDKNIFARKYFYPLTNSFDCFKGIYDCAATPNADYISKRVLTLPLYADLEIDDVKRICEVFRGDVCK